MRAVMVGLAFTILLAAPVQGLEAAGTLEQIAKTGKFRIGFRESSPPMSFLGNDGKPTGYSIDLCTYIVGTVQKQLALPTLKIAWVLKI